MSISNYNFQESRKPTKKCEMKIKQTKKVMSVYPCLIIILMEGSSLYGCYAKRYEGI